MTYYPDLGTKSYIANGAHIRAVGWLSPAHPYARGETTAEFRDRLATFCASWAESIDHLDWLPVIGPHLCEFCGQSRAFGNFVIPGKHALYVAPQMIDHYCAAHDYCPPSEFIEAVMACPDFTAPLYVELVAALEPQGKGEK
jgi:hypothetical protein